MNREAILEYFTPDFQGISGPELAEGKETVISLECRYPNDFSFGLTFPDKYRTIVNFRFDKSEPGSVVHLRIKFWFAELVTDAFGSGYIVQFQKDPHRQYPWNFENHSEYFLDKNMGSVFLDNKPITLTNILERLMATHLLPLRPFKGMGLRFRLGLLSKKKAFFRRAFRSTDLLCSVLFGSHLRIIAPQLSPASKSRIAYLAGIKTEEQRKPRKVKFFDIEVEVESLRSYAILHGLCFLFFLYFDIRPAGIRYILDYNFLTVLYALLSWFAYSEGARPAILHFRDWLRDLYEQSAIQTLTLFR